METSIILVPVQKVMSDRHRYISMSIGSEDLAGESAFMAVFLSCPEFENGIKSKIKIKSKRKCHNVSSPIKCLLGQVSKRSEFPNAVSLVSNLVHIACLGQCLYVECSLNDLPQHLYLLNGRPCPCPPKSD
jgi:hypothetical protein